MISQILMLVSGLTFSSWACSPGDADDQLIQARSGGLPLIEVADPVRAPLTAEERRFYVDAATLAWRFLDANYRPATGLVSATADWDYTTIWDVGGQLLAFLAARDLGFIDSADYERRTRRTLQTLERAELFRGIAFNKTYSTRDATMGTGQRSGTGWSATDLGRLLVALRVISVREPQFAAEAERIVRRIRIDQVVRGGYLHGQMIGSSGRPWTFQEGRIGYEQYAAAGFHHWGANVDNALDVRRNAEPVEVLGVRLLQDRRWQDRLVSEPFILMGLELGLPPGYRELAGAVLAAQEARYRRTGQITIATEDAVSLPPHYFYYYCVYCNRQAFVVDASSPGRPLSVPRWVSTKGAFGWHAILPSEYTRKALDYVQPARSARGWASGVFEGSGKTTNTFDVNTAAVILEVAAFQLRGGRPLIEPPAEDATPPATSQVSAQSPAHSRPPLSTDPPS
jgi:hypothetical protein